MGRLNTLPLLALLSACAPLQAAAPALPYPGGFAEGGWVTGRFSVALPGAPLFLEADQNTLYAAYPYQLITYREGLLQSLPLPGIPKFLRASSGKVLVGLGESVYTEEGFLPYPARDAAWGQEGLFWIGEGGLYRDAILLRPGAFSQVVAWDTGVVALGREAYFYPEGLLLPLPQVVRKAQTGACGVVALIEDWVYLVRPEGAKPVAKAQDFATWGETLYLSPGRRVVSCKEVVWP